MSLLRGATSLCALGARRLPSATRCRLSSNAAILHQQGRIAASTETISEQQHLHLANSHHQASVEEEDVENRLAVKAFYVSRSIDVLKLYEESSADGKMKQERFGKESVVLSVERPARGYVVVFSYGSVVFFNLDQETQVDCLTTFAPYFVEAIPQGFQPSEDYCVITRGERRDEELSLTPDPRPSRVIAASAASSSSPSSPSSSSSSTSSSSVNHHHPKQFPAASALSRAAATRREPTITLSTSLPSAKRTRTSVSPSTSPSEKHRTVDREELAAEIRFDAVVLPAVDVHNLSVIATVMAQSVALDHYSVKVDAMLETFTRLNSSVEKTGVFSALEKHSLFRLVALNNTLFTEIISKIGLLERSETAWKNVVYTQIWEGLRDEFEVEDRFQKMEFKLNLVQLNTKFFLEILANQKSNALEWIIIVLISLEIIVSSLELCNIRPFG